MDKLLFLTQEPFHVRAGEVRCGTETDHHTTSALQSCTLKRFWPTAQGMSPWRGSDRQLLALDNWRSLEVVRKLEMQLSEQSQRGALLLPQTGDANDSFTVQVEVTSFCPVSAYTQGLPASSVLSRYKYLSRCTPGPKLLSGS